MVIVDTSVWVRFLSNQAPYAAGVERLLSDGEAVGHEFVFGELLIGDRGGRRQLLDSYVLMVEAPVVPHSEVVSFIRERKLYGRGVGWVDAHLLASALVSRAMLWTADARLAAVANELGVAYSGK
ncbi:MAG: PIN domain-containing protein [Acidobacteria bacterium]|nr:PIN domain-containing protein [Acidobacteriota bacterium]